MELKPDKTYNNSVAPYALLIVPYGIETLSVKISKDVLDGF